MPGNKYWRASTPKVPTANKARKFERIPSHPAQYGQKMQTEKNLLGTPFRWEPCVFELSCPKLCYATDHALQIGIKTEEEIMKVPAVHRNAQQFSFWLGINDILGVPAL